MASILQAHVLPTNGLMGAASLLDMTGLLIAQIAARCHAGGVRLAGLQILLLLLA